MFTVRLFTRPYIYRRFPSAVRVILAHHTNCVNGSIFKKILIISLKGVEGKGEGVNTYINKRHINSHFLPLDL